MQNRFWNVGFVVARISEDQARAEMIAAGYSPLVPYPGSQVPWSSRCLTCGSDIAPRYTKVRQGIPSCKTCGFHKLAKSKTLDDSVAVAFMRERFFEPSEPYPSGHNAWRGTCTICGRESSPSLHNVRKNERACRHCNRERANKLISNDPNDARALMLAAGFEPFGDYPGAKKPWPGKCLKCGTEGAPAFSTVQGRGGDVCVRMLGYNMTTSAWFIR